MRNNKLETAGRTEQSVLLFMYAAIFVHLLGSSCCSVCPETHIDIMMKETRQAIRQNGGRWSEK